ncbi:MAG: Trk system potassium transporter TrkA, partial [Eubacteriales bacterium]|nr:Trk system potassium transporter TrkA [Eubacteriales bacterium]
ILPLCGNGADINMLREAGLDKADIFIAVSPSDELNLLSCLIAERVGRVRTIARVRNPLYSRETEFLKQKLGLWKIINPEHLAAVEIYKLLQYPALSRLDSFANGKVVIFNIHVKSTSRLVGLSLQELRRQTGRNLLACVVARGSALTIPSGSFVISGDDDISFVATLEEMTSFLQWIGLPSKPAQNCLITGGGTISYYLTEELLRHGRRVRIIENKPERCQQLSEYFPKAEIICGDGTDRKFLMKHGMGQADAFVPLTGIDEENIVIATYAKNISDAKVITKVSRADLGELIDALDIDSVVFPKLLCADLIAQYVRALADGAGGNVETLYRYLDNRVEIVEYKATDDPLLCRIPFIDLNLKKNLLVAALIRDGHFIIPGGQDMIMPGDSVIIVTMDQGLSTLHGILA